MEIALRARDGSIRAVALIDDADAGPVSMHRWSLHSGGYAQRSVIRDGKRVTLLLHREIMGFAPGDAPRVDHVNRDRLDCRRSNLRVATHAQNMQNVVANRGSSSRYRGVTWRADMGRWQAQGSTNGRYRYLGLFDCEEDAAAAAAAYRAVHMPFSSDAVAA